MGDTDIAGLSSLLRIEGWRINHKKVERLWREEGLSCQNDIRNGGACTTETAIIRMRPIHANHVWAIDFVHDKLSNGRFVTRWTVLGEFTRQALCVEVRDKMNSDNGFCRSCIGS